MHVYASVTILHWNFRLVDTLGQSFTTPPGSTVEGANYSLYVLGGNGVLVEHHLAPQKLPTAPDGEDAPIELQHFSKLCWRLMGFVDYIKYSNQCNKTKLFERKSVLVCINRTSFLRSSRDL